MLTPRWRQRWNRARKALIDRWRRRGGASRIMKRGGVEGGGVGVVICTGGVGAEKLSKTPFNEYGSVVNLSEILYSL